jgi:hypothetical protein
VAIQPNYLARGGDPYAGQAAINEDSMASIGTALFGNPQVAGQRALRTAQAEQIGLENERARRGLEYGDRFGADMAGVFTVKNPDGSTRPATFAEAAPRLGDLFKSAYWANNGDPTRTANWLRAFTAMTGNEDLTRAGYAASGLALGPDFAATTGRADQVQARNAASDKDRATAVAGIGAGATVQAARIGQEGAATRQRDELKWKSENPTYDQVRARTTQTFVDDPLLGPDQRTERQELIVAPGVQTARERAAGQAQAARERGDASVRVAEIRGLSAENVARLVQEGKVTAADIAAHARVEAAETTAGATVTAADKAAAARVEAAVIGLQGTQDTNTTRRDIAQGNNQTQLATTAMRGASSERVAELTAQGRVDAADAAAHSRVEAARLRGDAQIASADLAAHARVEATAAVGQTARDVANTNASARRDTASTAASAARDVANTAADARRDTALIQGETAQNVAATRANASVVVADLAKQGRISVAESAAWSRVEAAKASGSAQIAAADLSAHARVQAALAAAQAARDVAETGASARRDVASTAAGAARDVATAAAGSRTEAAQIQADADRDVAATRAGAPKPAIAIPSAVSKGWDTEIEALVGESNFSVNDEAKLWLKQRAGEIYQQPGPGQRNSTAAMRQAWEDFKAADPANTRGSLGRMLFSPRFGAPTPPSGTAPLVPGRSAAPAAPATPAAGATPPRPPNVPPGSAYSPSRDMWRAPDGRMFTKDGVPAA